MYFTKKGVLWFDYFRHREMCGFDVTKQVFITEIKTIKYLFDLDFDRERNIIYSI